MAGAAG